MATLVDNTNAMSNMVDMLGRLNISPQDLQAANEIPLAHALATLIDNVNHAPSDLQHFLFKNNTYESPETHFGGNGQQYETTLNLFEYRPPSESEIDIDPLLVFPHDHSTCPALDLSAHRDDDLSMQLDGMTIDDTGSGSSFFSLPETMDHRGSAASFGNIYPAFSAYTNPSASPPVPSFYEFLEDAGIDIEQYEELARRYSPDVQWEDISPSVREYQIQEMYLEKVGDLCNEMAGIRMSEDSSGSMPFNAPTECNMTMAQEQFNSPKPFNAATEDNSLMSLGNLICFDSLTNSEREEEVESALFAPTSHRQF